MRPAATSSPPARAGETAVNDTANVLGLAILGLPTLVLLAFFVPLGGLQIRRLTLGAQALSRDPIGDLEAHNYEPLLAALYADAGIRPPGAR